MENMTGCKEIKGEFAGVKIPKWIRFFDCRISESDLDKGNQPKTPWGSTLWGAERAAYEMGLITAKGWDNDFSDTPTSCQCYCDFRDCSAEYLNKTVQDMVKSAKDRMKLYNKTLKEGGTDRQHGATHEYKPLAVELSNYGWSIIADKRIFARRFL